MRITCPHCHGSCVEKTDRRIEDTQHQHTDATVPCTRCNGRGWIDDGVTTVLPPPPSRRTEMHDGGTKKPRQAEGWLLGVGALILLGDCWDTCSINSGYRSRPPDTDEVERPQPESASQSLRRHRQTQRVAPMPMTSNRQALMPAVYMVTYKHRLRDCHGRLTFTRKGLRYRLGRTGDSIRRHSRRCDHRG